MGDMRKKSTASNSKQANFNDWIQKSIETYNPKHQPREIDDILNNSTSKDAEPQNIMWPSAADKKEETGKIQWLSKTKEDKERAIERELDNEDDFDSDYVQPVQPRKQQTDERPLNSKFAQAA